MKIIDLGIDGDNLVALADTGSVYRKSGDGWEQLPGFANTGSVARRPIAATHYGPGDALVVLVQDQELGGRAGLYRLDGNGWVSLGGPPNCADEKRARRTVGLTRYGSSVAVVTDDGDLFALEPGGWIAIPGPSRE